MEKEAVNPPVILYANKSAESKKAFQVLKNIPNLIFKVVKTKDQLKVVWGPFVYQGITEIKKLTSTMTNFDQTMIEQARKQIPQLFWRGNPMNKADYKKLRELQLKPAQVALDKIIK